MSKTSNALLIAATAVLLFTMPVFGGIVITIDENGNGINTLGPGVLGNDPGPGGLNNVLIYRLPFQGLQGDVLLLDGAVFLDVLRFNGDGTVIFYSDNVDGVDAIGDTPGPPGAFYQNIVRIPEVGLEGGDGAVYTPTEIQPGFAAQFLPTYVFISDGTAAPEPGSMGLLALGLGAIGFAVRRKLAR